MPALSAQPVARNGLSRRKHAGPRSQKLAHVVRYAGETFQAGLGGRGGPTQLVHSCPGAGGERRGSNWPGRVPIGSPSSAVKAHRRFDAASSFSAHIDAPAAEMGDDHRPRATSGANLAQSTGDIFIGDPLKAIARTPCSIEGARQGIAIGMLRRALDGSPCRNRRPAARRV